MGRNSRLRAERRNQPKEASAPKRRVGPTLPEPRLNEPEYQYRAVRVAGLPDPLPLAEQESFSVALQAYKAERKAIAVGMAKSGMTNEAAIIRDNIERLDSYREALRLIRKIERGTRVIVDACQLDITDVLCFLLKVACSDSRFGSSDRETFLGSHYADVRRVGEALHLAGGWRLMHTAADHMPIREQHSLDVAWNQIGDWLC